MKFLIYIFLFFSMMLNVVVLERYGVIDKIKNKIVHYFNTSTVMTKGGGTPYTRENNKPIVIYLKNNKINKINKTFKLKTNEIPNELIMPAGAYNFLGSHYLLQDEGLYRFFLPGKINVQRIIYKNDLDSLLSSISWIVTHGNSDNRKSNLELSDKALHSKLFLTCGNISAWAHSILSKLNIKSRVVASLTMDNWNDYDNGHTLIEVWRGKYNKWVVYDLDNNSYFTSNKGTIPLNLLEFSQSVITNNYKVIYLSVDTKLDVSDFRTKDDYNYNFFAENINVNIRDWYRRMLQVPMIYSGDKYYFMDKENNKKVESYSTEYKYMDKNSFLNKFYSKEYHD